VTDFRWNGAGSREIGRDFDHVRPIVWKEDPGKAFADLLAAVLAERGVAVVRAAGDAAAPPGAAGRLGGAVEEFRVRVRRVDVLKVEYSARVAAVVEAVRPGEAAPWTTRVAVDYVQSEAFFVTPEGVQSAVNGAANAAAEEAAARLAAAGIAEAAGSSSPAVAPAR